MNIKEKIKKWKRPYYEYTVEELKKDRKHFVGIEWLFLMFSLMILAFALYFIYSLMPLVVESIENFTPILGVVGAISIVVVFSLFGFYWYYSLITLHYCQKVDILDLFIFLKQKEEKE